MWKMKQVCDELDLPYETLRFYCNEGLVPHVKRDENNHRLFDQKDVAWIRSLLCLRACGLGIDQLKEYMGLCLQGKESIPQRKLLLAQKREQLVQEMEKIQASIAYIDNKQVYFEQILSGEVPFTSNLIQHKEA